ncbi:hypothetical protein BSKO_00770 [Bryopsis sp. KO-2023]|nr:hypothetical protein BSKO_00770 [Bryopsis sp. KO-2023]
MSLQLLRTLAIGTLLLCSAEALPRGRVLSQSPPASVQLKNQPFILDPESGQKLYVDLNGRLVKQPGVLIKVEPDTNRVYVPDPTNKKRVYIGSDESKGEVKAKIEGSTGQIYVVSPFSEKKIFLEIVADLASLPGVIKQIQEILSLREAVSLQQPGRQAGRPLRAEIQINPSIGQAFITNPRTQQRIYLAIFVDPETLPGFGEASIVRTDPTNGRLFVPNPSSGSPVFVNLVPDATPQVPEPVDGPPIQVDFLTGQAFVIDPNTREVIFLDTLVVPNASQEGALPSRVQVDPGTGRAFVLDPTTRKKTFVQILPSPNQAPPAPSPQVSVRNGAPGPQVSVRSGAPGPQIAVRNGSG